MAHEDFYKAMRIVHLMLKAMGMPILRRQVRDFSDLFKNTTLCCFSMTWMGSVDLVLLINLFYHLSIGNFVDALFLWPCVYYGFYAFFKALSILYHKNLVENMLGRLEEFRLEERDSEASAAYEAYEKLEFKYLKRILTLTIVFNGSMLLNFCLTPLVSMLLAHIKNDEIKVSTIFPVIYGPILDPSQNWGHYLIVYLHHVYSAVFCALAAVTTDYMMYLLCSCIYIQFQELGYKMEKIILYSMKRRRVCADDDNLNDQEDDVDEGTLNDNFVYVILRHQELMAKVEEINAIYSKTMLFNFAMNSSFMCVTGFNVMIMTGLSKAPFLLLSVSALWQVLTMCYYGDLIMRSNLDISTSLVKCNWYLAGKNFKRNLLILLLRAQKPCKIHAYKFVDVDLQAFRKFLASTWSYFALLNSVYSRNETDE